LPQKADKKVASRDIAVDPGLRFAVPGEGIIPAKQVNPRIGLLDRLINLVDDLESLSRQGLRSDGEAMKYGRGVAQRSRAPTTRISVPAGV